MKIIFVDTFYFLAIINSKDAYHNKAVQYSESIECISMTTAWELTELANGMSLPTHRTAFLQLYNSLKSNSFCIIIPPTQQLFENGHALYLNRPDKSWSLTDCISFVVMKENNITEALPGDHHFEQAGYRALLT